MGMNKKGEPAGFCFIIFSQISEAELAVNCLNQTKFFLNKLNQFRLDDRIIRVDRDIGR